MSAGSNPGADVVNFRFHITDINASLQSSSVVSVENDQMMPCGNKGEIVTEKTTKQIQEHKQKIQQIDEKIQRIEAEKQRIEAENQVLRKEIKRRHRDTTPAATYRIIKIIKMCAPKKEELALRQTLRRLAAETQIAEKNQEKQTLRRLAAETRFVEGKMDKLQEEICRKINEKQDGKHYACIGCGNPDVKYTACGGIEGRNMCEECWT